MIVVSNTSPLIALSKINQLVILSRLFEKILIPQLVIDEFLVNCLETEGNALTHFCQSDSVNTVHVEMNKFFSRRLGTGEQAVLSLALQKQVETVLIDDRKAFNEAKALGLMPISTRAILRVAVQREMINDLAGLENQLQTKQFFLPHY